MEINVKKKLIIPFAVLAFINLSAKSNDLIKPIDGKWQIKLDREDVGIRDSWNRQEFKDTINLPDSLKEKVYDDSHSKIKHRLS